MSRIVTSARRGVAVVSCALVVVLVGCSSDDGASPNVTLTAGAGGAAASGGAQGGKGGSSGNGASSGTGGRSGGAGTGGVGAGGSGGGGKSGGAGAAGSGGVSAGGAGGHAAGAGANGGGAGSNSSGGSPATGGSGGQTVAIEDVHVSGRTDKVGATHRFGWSGVSFTTTFSGTGLSVTLEDTGSSNEFEVIVDGARQADRTIQAAKGMQSYPVIDQLPAGDHTATIHRRTEGSLGITTFHGFDVQGGAVVPTPSPFHHRMEVIGDSITCGYGTECTSAGEAFSPKTENHWLTYGAIAADTLAADAHIVAWSGKGLVGNYGTDTSATMPELYPRTLATAAAPTWDFSTWIADVVVIDLGTNDWNHNPPVDPAVFEAAYDAFASDIEGKYPGVLVFGIGNTLVGKTHTQAVMSAMGAKPNRHYVEFAVHAGEGVCCGHPCAVTHARWGMELSQAVLGVTGW